LVEPMMKVLASDVSKPTPDSVYMPPPHTVVSTAAPGAVEAACTAALLHAACVWITAW
jgi:hypothetical protein